MELVPLEPEQETDRTRPWDTHLCIERIARQHAKQDQQSIWRVTSETSQKEFWDANQA